MTSESLGKFKAGLRDGIYLADQLADLATQHPIPEPTKQPASPSDSAIDLLTTDLIAPGLNPALTQRRRAHMALRRAQVAHLHSRPSRELAWLLTLAAGGGRGYARYSARLLENDPALADARIMAFKEVLLRHGGSLVLWGFMRGLGTLGAFVKHAVAQCAEEVLFFEESAQVFAEDGEEDGEMPSGLHMCIMEELNRRMTEERRAEAAEKGELWSGDVDTREVWEAVHALVGKEVGSETWSGYGAIKYPA